MLNSPTTSIAERRTALREKAGERLTLRTDRQALDGELIDRSLQGLGVRTERALELGSSVNVEGTVLMVKVWMHVSGFASVVHCQPTDDGYRIGLQLHNAQWSPAQRRL